MKMKRRLRELAQAQKWEAERILALEGVVFGFEKPSLEWRIAKLELGGSPAPLVSEDDSAEQILGVEREELLALRELYKAIRYTGTPLEWRDWTMAPCSRERIADCLDKLDALGG